MRTSICVFLAIILDEIHDRNGNLKKQYESLLENEYFKMIEKKLCSIHALFHCDIVGVIRYKNSLKELKEQYNKDD